MQSTKHGGILSSLSLEESAATTDRSLQHGFGLQIWLMFTTESYSITHVLSKQYDEPSFFGRLFLFYAV
jgi:hypothetical protein